LQEIRRVLRQGGLFAFSSHNRNHRDAISWPKIEFSTTPYEQIGHFTKFVKYLPNHLINRNEQRFENDYATISNVAHNYAMLTYYIDKENQISQLDDVGFKAIEMYDALGNMLNLDSDDKDSAWIYPAARKINHQNDT
jgi:SAM-dependent methyltransferase